MKRMEAEITLETFSYRKYFPESPNADVFDRRCNDRSAKLVSAELFRPFAEKWFALKQIEWRASYEETIRDVLDIYLLPHFGDRAIKPEVAGSSPVARPTTQDGGYRNIDFSPFSLFYQIWIKLSNWEKLAILDASTVEFYWGLQCRRPIVPTHDQQV